MRDFLYSVDEIIFQKFRDFDGVNLLEIGKILQRKRIVLNEKVKFFYQIESYFTGHVEWINQKHIRRYRMINRYELETFIPYGQLYSFWKGEWYLVKWLGDNRIRYVNYSFQWDSTVPFKNLLLHVNGEVHGILNTISLLSLGKFLFNLNVFI